MFIEEARERSKIPDPYEDINLKQMSSDETNLMMLNEIKSNEANELGFTTENYNNVKILNNKFDIRGEYGHAQGHYLVYEIPDESPEEGKNIKQTIVLASGALGNPDAVQHLAKVLATSGNRVLILPNILSEKVNLNDNQYGAYGRIDKILGDYTSEGMFDIELLNDFLLNNPNSKIIGMYGESVGASRMARIIQLLSPNISTESGQTEDGRISKFRTKYSEKYEHILSANPSFFLDRPAGISVRSELEGFWKSRNQFIETLRIALGTIIFDDNRKDPKISKRRLAIKSEKRFTSSKLLAMLNIPRKLPGTVYDAIYGANTEGIRIHIGLGALDPLIHIDEALHGVRRLKNKGKIHSHKSQVEGRHNTGIESPVETSLNILRVIESMKIEPDPNTLILVDKLLNDNFSGR